MEERVPGEFETGLSAFKGHPLTSVESVVAAPSAAAVSRVAATLADLDITDAEQLLAVAAVDGMRAELASVLTVSETQLERILDAARQLIPTPLVPMLETPAAADLALGVLEPTTEMLAEAMAIEPMEAPFAALPPSVNRINRMSPIRNQASRGTCVAFTVTALHEFYNRVRGNPQDFSEQHLYYETKLIDGAPNACGTWQAKAVIPLSNLGQCRESVWAYNPNPPCNQPGPRPAQARPDAAHYRLATQALNARDVLAIKIALAGGSVATISIPVYNSWYASSATRLTGRITMRIGSEASVGGHAVCLVGYQDAAASPGGGYFIVRNSWGTTWGSQCPYGAGYGTIPYQYITNDNWESYTVRIPATGDTEEPLPTPQEGVRTITIETGGNYNIIIR